MQKSEWERIQSPGHVLNMMDKNLDLAEAYWRERLRIAGLHFTKVEQVEALINLSVVQYNETNYRKAEEYLEKCFPETKE